MENLWLENRRKSVLGFSELGSSGETARTFFSVFRPIRLLSKLVHVIVSSSGPVHDVKLLEQWVAVSYPALFEEEHSVLAFYRMTVCVSLNNVKFM
jgi:hypothetical protein